MATKSSTSDTTSWQCSVSTHNGVPTSLLTVTINGGSPIRFNPKGVCYSPCPMNASNAYAPAIGDWFWDSFSVDPNTKISNWSPLWARDLPNIRSLGANTLRVYCMLSRQLNNDGTIPTPYTQARLQTHVQFLDQCWNGGKNPLYVMVGLPMPQLMYWLQNYNQASQAEIQFWTNVFSETIQQVASHPAVLGFIIQNELDSNIVTYGSDTKSVNFWWSQVAELSRLAKQAMGSNKKLVGMAVHDDPNIPLYASQYMAQCPNIDFWGVNSYQPQSLQYIFTVPKPGYSGLTGAALKPVILTEWGLPATSHRNLNDPSTIYTDDQTIANTAKSITTVVPQAFNSQQPLCLGLYYFEYSDEYWNQVGSPNIYTWWGGDRADGFPNKYWDQEGFGLWSIARGAGLHPNSPVWANNGPNTPIDVLTVRMQTYKALSAAFAQPTHPHMGKPIDTNE